LASKLLACPVHFFRHNDAGHLREILESHSYERAIVAVEGIYSMSGDILEREIFTVCALDKVIMIVDEAHSAGVLGDDFLGVFSHYDITPQPNHIKMGTLGKALGSYGAYILASEETISFLQNRAKAIVYATAPSLFDIALGHEAFLKIETSVEGLKVLREARIMCAKTFFDKKIEGLILPIEVSDKQKLLSLRDAAQEEGFVIGAIRPPTVDVAMLRIILRLNTPLEEIERLLGFIKQRAS
jgi:8-amino-7-oxononanoate synthase